MIYDYEELTQIMCDLETGMKKSINPPSEMGESAKP